MYSSNLPPSSSLSHRRTSQTAHEDSSSDHIPLGTPHQNIAPAPTPRPVFQLLAFAVVILLALLQFLPATHVRDPVDPSRRWVPIKSNTDSLLTKSEASRISGNSGDDGMVHIVSWMDCLDLRVLAVLANSTLSSSSHPELIFFHFFIPGGSEDKLSYYKLKVLFPQSNLEILGQVEVKGKIGASFSGRQYTGPNFEEIVPFIIPNVHPFSSKFIFISPRVIMKARVEELIGVDLKDYSIAVAEDCSERLSNYVNSQVLDAIQRSASRPWVSETPYIKDACLPDLSLILINVRNMENDFLEAVLWWSKVLNLNERSRQKDPALALAIYNRYLKLSPSWLAKNSVLSEVYESEVIHYDGPKTLCDASASSISVQVATGSIWSQYLPTNSDRILDS